MAPTDTATADRITPDGRELPPESLATLKMWLVELKRCDIITESDFKDLSRTCHELKRRYHDGASLPNKEAAASDLHNAVCDATTNIKARRHAREVIQAVMTDRDKETGEMNRTPVYGHLANDGKLFVSFGTGYVFGELDDATPSTLGVTEWVEGEWFGAWGETIEELLTPEPERETEPPRIGTLYYDFEGERVDVEIWPKEKAL